MAFRKVIVDPANEAALLSYQHAFRRLSGMQVSLDYLRQARVTVFYRGEKMVCGYVLNITDWNPLRYFSFFSAPMRQSLLTDRGMAESELIELTCLWKIKKMSPMLSASYFFHMIFDAWRVGTTTRKRYLVGGSVLATIRAFQRKLLTTDLYIGFIPNENLATQLDQLVAIYACKLSRIPVRATLIILNRFVFRLPPLHRFFRPARRGSAVRSAAIS